MRNTIFFVIFGLSAFAFIGCSSTEIGESKDVSQDKIYQAYTVLFSEAEKECNILAQYRFAGPDGTTLVLTPPSNFILNGNCVAVDSNSFQGAYYKTALSSSSAWQEQVFVFTDLNKHKYKNHFLLKKFSWLNPPKKVSVKENLRIFFDTDPLKQGDYIEIGTLETDSSFSVRYSSFDTGNTITIPSVLLQKLPGEKLVLKAIMYRKANLTQATTEGGVINSCYESMPVTILLSR